MSALDMWHQFVAAQSLERSCGTGADRWPNPVRRATVAEVAGPPAVPPMAGGHRDRQGNIGSSSCKKRTGGKVRTGVATYLISC